MSAIGKEEARAAIADERRQWREIVEAVGEDRVDEKAFGGGSWSFRDLVAHLNAWRGHSLRQLESIAAGQERPAPIWPSELSGDDEINAWFDGQNAGRSWDEVKRETEEHFDRTEQLVERLADGQLNDSGLFPNLEGHSFGEQLVSRGYWGHFHDDHEADIRQWLEAKSPTNSL